MSAVLFCFTSRRRHTRCGRDWSSDVCSSDLWLLIEAPTVIPSQKLTRWDEDHVLFHGFNKCCGITSRFRLAACLFDLDVGGGEKIENDSSNGQASEDQHDHQECPLQPLIQHGSAGEKVKFDSG